MFYLASILAHGQTEIPEQLPPLYPTLREACDALNELYQDSLDAYQAGDTASIDFNFTVIHTPFDHKELSFIYRTGWQDVFLSGAPPHCILQEINKARQSFTEDELPAKTHAILRHLATSTSKENEKKTHPHHHLR